MRSTLIATASAVMLMAAPALAQTVPSAPSRTPDPNASISAPAPIPRTPAPDPLKMEDVSKISGFEKDAYRLAKTADDLKSMPEWSQTARAE